MKRQKVIYPLVALILVVTAAFAIDMNSNQASVLSLPDFSGTTDIAQADEKPAASLRQLNDAIVDIADQTTPTVVTVRVTQTVEVPNNPFSRFFGMPEQGGERQRRGLGSGVIVSEDGYILTNNHVVADAEEIMIDLSNGESYDGEVVGRDPQTDIAVVKIDANDLNAIKVGDSNSVRVGEMVLAIGSPLSENLAHSVSMGIISAKDRAIGILEDTQGYETFLQTDAAINPGNSGGALVNMDGELIGINSAIASRNGGNDGIGFAVPSNLAKSIMESLITDGEIKRGYLGISWGGDVDRTMARAMNLDKAQGIIVGSVEEDGPADRAGIAEGDIIQSLNGERISGWTKFRSAIGTSKPGETIRLNIIHDGEPKQVQMKLGASPSANAVAAPASKKQNEDMQKQLGFSIENISPSIAEQLELTSGQQGVVVNTIRESSNAARKGLQRGAVIVSVNREPVRNMEDFRNEINKVAQKQNPIVLLQVIPYGAPQMKRYVAFEL